MPRKYLPLPPRELLLSLFIYDPETGVLISRKLGKEVGGRNELPYPRVKINKVCYVTHRVIWRMMTEGPMPEEVDHINGIRNDKRWCNLRAATLKQNSYNFRQSPKNTSGFKCVSWSKVAKRWRSYISVNRKQFHLGYFDDPADAYEAYLKAAVKYHGKFANDGFGPICL